MKPVLFLRRGQTRRQTLLPKNRKTILHGVTETIDKARIPTHNQYSFPLLLVVDTECGSGIVRTVDSVSTSKNETTRCQLTVPIMKDAPVAHRRERARQLFRELSSPNSQSTWASAGHVVEWIEEDPGILWVPLTAGHTLMHLACSALKREQLYGAAMNTANTNNSSTTTFESGSNHTRNSQWNVWKWILTQASVHQHEYFLTKRDKAGETCMDCFMLAWVHNHTSATSSARNPAASNFARAVERVLESPNALMALQRLLQTTHKEDDHNSISSTPVRGDVHLVAKVWQAFICLCRAASTGHVEAEDACSEVNQINIKNSNNDTIHQSFPILHFLAKLGNCPDVFAKLAIHLFPEKLRQKDANGYLPIHWWALSPTHMEGEDVVQGLVPCMIRSGLDTLSWPSPNGQQPIHLALGGGIANYNNNKPLREVQLMWEACPRMLAQSDPVTGHFPFALAASSSRAERRRIVRGLHRRGPSVSLYDWLDATRNMDGVELDVSCYLLGCIYDMLRAYPQALQESVEMASCVVEEKCTSEDANFEDESCTKVL